MTHLSTNPLKDGVVEEYIPAIYIPNIEIADFNKQPLVCVGFEVDTDQPGMEIYEGYIVAWYYDANSTLHEILMNEETAMSTTNPVFIVNNAEEKATYLEKSVIEAQKSSQLSPILKSTNSLEYCSYEFQINLRYDNSNHSEFSITAAHIDENGEVYNS